MEQLQEQFRWFLDPLKDHYFDFEGRVTRQAYWMFFLWYFIIYAVLNVPSDELAGLFALAVLLPHLGLGARRLHDTGKSGWWLLVGLIPVIGWIAIIYLLAQQGVAGPNQYGADPRTTTSTTSVSTPIPAAPAVTTATPGVESSAVPTDGSAMTDGGVK